MHRKSNPLYNRRNRYSAKNMAKPVNFFCFAPEARRVAIVGDFNDWQPDVNPMIRQPDGSWHIVVALNHGHHHYQFIVDGRPMLDPRATGIARNESNDRVSLIAIS
jgi:1,4-alpha-glucan branching enzyme